MTENTDINIGFRSLRESTQEQAHETYKSEELREKNKQQAKREASKSQNKDTQDASHLLGLKEACDVIGQEGGVDISNKENLESLKKVLNSSDNMRMKDSHSNRSNDKIVDAKIEKKIKEGTPLTQKEEEKEKRVAELFQKHQDELTPEIYNTFEDHLKKAKTRSNHTAWDARRDTKKMKEARKAHK